MKTSILLLAALFVNTTLLIAEPVSTLLESTSIWPFIILEVLLFLGFYFHIALRDFRRATKPDFTSLKIFVIKGDKKIESDFNS